MTGRRAQALLAAVCVAGLSACASVEETRVPVKLAPIETTLQIERQWQASAGGGPEERALALRPVKIDQRIYTVDGEGLVEAFAVDTGERLWRQNLDLPVTAGVNGADDLIAVGTRHGLVVALATADGHELWRRQLSSSVMALSSPELGTLVARTNDGKVYALDRGSGEPLWQTGRQTPALTLRGASTPVVSTGKLVVGFDNGDLVALSPLRGDALWETTISAPSGATELERIVDIDGAIRVRDGIVYAASFQGRVAAVTLSEGRVLWSREISSYQGVDIDAEQVYVTDDKSHVWALDRRTGATLWTQDKLEYRELTAPVAMDDYVLVGDYEGYIHWLAQGDGHFVARTRVGERGIAAAPLVVDGQIYVLGEGGRLVRLAESAPDKQARAADEG